MLTFVLPTLNEVMGVATVVKEINSLGIPSRILVVDGESTDGTVAVATKLGAVAICVKGGKGVAFRAALKRLDAEYAIMVDADGTYSLEPFARIALALLTKADVVVGYRKFKQRDSMSVLNRVGNSCLSLFASMLYRRKIYDLCSGLWAFKVGKVRTFSLTSAGFTLEADLWVNALKSRCRIEQVPIVYRKRLGRPKLRVLDGFKIGLFLIKRRF